MKDNQAKDFWRLVFCENGSPSSKRVMGAICLVVCLFCLVWLTIKEGGTRVVENIMQTLLIVSSALLGISSVTSIWKGNKTAIGKHADHTDEHNEEPSDEIER
jgi:hypothetical protein